MTLNYLVIGKQIKRIRTEHHLSQAQLAEMIDLSSGYLSYIETGTKGASLDTIVQLANALRVSVDEILADNLVTNQQRIAKGELSDLLEDCNSYEKAVILDIARSTKQTLKSYQKMKP